MNTPLNASGTLPGLIVCFSHLRWDFVFQRPQHLLTRFARNSRIFYMEEPVFHEGEARLLITQEARLLITQKEENIDLIVPQLPAGLSTEEQIVLQQNLLAGLLEGENLAKTAFWYYTPMALPFSRAFQPALVVFDCMDELSAFRFAPRELLDLEAEMLQRADIVFTGGASLHAAKTGRHQNIHLFPSSIDQQHFGKARNSIQDPQDQSSIPHPRLGFFGVIDERFDAELIAEVASQQPDWQIILIGPVVKIDPATLPKGDNIHYLGGKSYSELPDYLSGWDIALIPFALNESTRFISPTKTPEYLAAGKPVISSPLRDVVSPYGEEGLVCIGATSDEWIEAAESLLANTDRDNWQERVDEFLEGNSWDLTCAQMMQLMQQTLQEKATKTIKTVAMA